MSDSACTAASAGVAGPSLWRKLIMTVLLSALAGPLIGTAMFLIFTPSGLLPEGIAEIAGNASIPFALLLGYVSGGLQAILCGIGFAVLGWRFGRLPIWSAIVIALPLALAFKLVVFGMLGDGFILSILIHLVPALVAWWLVRPYWQRAKA